MDLEDVHAPQFDHSAGGGNTAEWGDERSDVAAVLEDILEDVFCSKAE